MKRKLFILVAVLACVLALAVLAVAVLLDGAVKKAAETLGPQLAKVTVSMDSVRISILSGHGSVHGLLVGNPEGYTTPAALKTDRASVAIAPGSLLSDKVVIRSIEIIAPEINFEGGLKDNNLTKILANIEASLGGGKEGAGTGGDAGAAGKKLQIDRFVLKDAKVNVTLKGLTSKAMTLSLASVEVTGLGTGPEGVTAAEASRKVVQAVLGDTTKLVTGALGQLGKGVADAAQNLGEGAAKTASEGASKVGKGVTDLFKKRP